MKVLEFMEVNINEGAVRITSNRPIGGDVSRYSQPQALLALESASDLSAVSITNLDRPLVD